MNISHARILLLACLVTAGLSSCHDTETVVDAMHGPENVLGAPLLNKEENHQFDKTNSKLYDEAVAEDLFHSKKADAAPADTSAHAHMEGAADANPEAPVTQSADTAHGGHAAEGHAEKH